MYGSACQRYAAPRELVLLDRCRCCQPANPISKFSAGNNPRPKTLLDSARAHAVSESAGSPRRGRLAASVNGTPVVPVSRGEGGRCRMPRTATATPVRDGEVSTMRVDDLIQRGRSQGHLSLSELRTAFEQAGIAPRRDVPSCASWPTRACGWPTSARKQPKSKRTTPRPGTVKAGTAKASTAEASTAEAGGRRSSRGAPAPPGASSEDKADAHRCGGRRRGRSDRGRSRSGRAGRGQRPAERG